MLNYLQSHALGWGGGLILAVGGAGAANVVPQDAYWDPMIGNPGLTNDIFASTGEAVRGIALHTGQIFVAGQFTSAGGVAATNVARWDGAGWSAVGDGLQSEFGGIVMDLEFAGAELYATGVFYRSGNLPARYIARWDGEKWSPLGSGLNSLGRALVAQGTDLYVGGDFTIAGEVPANCIAKWDGTNWSALGAGVRGGQVGPLVNTIAVNGSMIVVGGAFRQAGDVPAQNVAMWDGKKWTALGNGLATVTSVAFHRGELYAGGNFRIAETEEFSILAKWTGSEWLLLTGVLGTGDSFARSLRSIGTDLYMGAGGVRTPEGANLLRIAADGQVTAVGGGIDPGGGVYDLHEYKGGLYVGGLFTQAGGIPARNIALWQIPRMLAVERREHSVALSWPAADTNLVLESAGDMPSTRWAPVPEKPTVVNGRLRVTNDVSSAEQFYRLRERVPGAVR